MVRVHCRYVLLCLTFLAGPKAKVTFLSDSVSIEDAESEQTLRFDFPHAVDGNRDIIVSVQSRNCYLLLNIFLLESKS